MDLKTRYLGFDLKNPLVPSAAAPLTDTLDKVRALEDGGAAAIVLYSLFEEQIEHEAEELDFYLTRSTHSYAEAVTYFPDLDRFNVGPEKYLDHLRACKEAVDVPIIASLNGISMGGWTHYASKLEEAGADALEINIYFIPADPNLTGADVEQMYVDVVSDIKKRVSIPVTLKMGPFFTAMFDMAKKMESAGADGLVLFNRFFQPDVDLEELEIQPSLVLSSPFELRLPLRWIAILYGRVGMNLAATRGIHDGLSALKMISVGADVTMLCSELLRRGPKRIAEIEREMKEWLEAHEYDSLDTLRGSMSQKACPDPAAFERANYMKTLQSFRDRESV